MPKSRLTLQEHRTTLSPDEVLQQAKGFFSNRNSLYATFIDREGPGFCTFRGQGGEEVVIAATRIRPVARSASMAGSAS